MKDLISLHDLTSDEVKGLLELGLKIKKEQKSGIEHHILKGKTLGMIFTKSSTRTRVSFEVGMTQLAVIRCSYRQTTFSLDAANQFTILQRFWKECLTVL